MLFDSWCCQWVVFFYNFLMRSLLAPAWLKRTPKVNKSKWLRAVVCYDRLQFAIVKNYFQRVARRYDIRVRSKWISEIKLKIFTLIFRVIYDTQKICKCLRLFTLAISFRSRLSRVWTFSYRHFSFCRARATFPLFTQRTARWSSALDISLYNTFLSSI